jgi:hypothetical protein
MPERSLELWNQEILLKPYFADIKGLDGTIGDHSFIKIDILGSGGFSKVYLGNPHLISEEER